MIWLLLLGLAAAQECQVGISSNISSFSAVGEAYSFSIYIEQGNTASSEFVLEQPASCQITCHDSFLNLTNITAHCYCDGQISSEDVTAGQVTLTFSLLCSSGVSESNSIFYDPSPNSVCEFHPTGEIPCDFQTSVSSWYGCVSVACTTCESFGGIPYGPACTGCVEGNRVPCCKDDNCYLIEECECLQIIGAIRNTSCEQVECGQPSSSSVVATTLSTLVPSSTASPTPTPYETPSPTPVPLEPLEVTPSPSPIPTTPTPSSSPTPTPVPEPTPTPVVSPTAAVPPTPTPAPVPTPTPTPAVCNDLDEDSVCDSMDNCPLVANLDQSDLDQDGIGDVCDNCPFVYNPDQLDSNSTGIGDACRPSPPPIVQWNFCWDCVPSDAELAAFDFDSVISEDRWICDQAPSTVYAQAYGEWSELADLVIEALAISNHSFTNRCNRTLQDHVVDSSVYLCVTTVFQALETDCVNHTIPSEYTDFTQACVDRLQIHLQGNGSLLTCEELDSLTSSWSTTVQGLNASTEEIAPEATDTEIVIDEQPSEVQASTPSASAEPVYIPSCGNGIVDPDEECDYAIPALELVSEGHCTEDCHWIAQIETASSDSNSSTTTASSSLDAMLSQLGATIGMAIGMAAVVLVLLALVFGIKVYSADGPRHMSG